MNIMFLVLLSSIVLGFQPLTAIMIVVMSLLERATADNGRSKLMNGGPSMKPICVIIFVMALVPASALAEAKKPLAKWTCADFLAVEDAFKPKVIYWATAYSKAGKPETATIDIEGTEKIVPMITEDCTKTPKESFWHKLKNGWRKVETEMEMFVTGCPRSLISPAEPRATI